MKMKLWVFCLLSCLAVAATADAQPGGGGRGGRGGGMFGGGGFGGGGPGALFFVVGNSAVQKELNLNEADAEKIKTITDDHGTAMRDAMRDAGGGANFQDMTDEERTKLREKWTEAGKTVNDKFLPKLKDALTADQFVRLQQINWQNSGTGALSEPEVIKAVTISKDQQDKIKTISDEFAVKRRELFQGGGQGGGQEAFQKMQEMNKERDAKITEVLSKDQQDKFASLKGKEFDVAQLRPQFGRGGRGGPGGGGNGGGGGGNGGGRAKRPQPKAE